MDRLWPNPFRLSLLAALVLGLVQAQPCKALEGEGWQGGPSLVPGC